MPDYTDLPPGAKVIGGPRQPEQQFSDLPPGAQVIGNAQSQGSPVGRFVNAVGEETGLKHFIQNPGEETKNALRVLVDPVALVDTVASAIKGLVYDQPKELLGKGVDAIKQGDYLGGARSIGNAAIPAFGGASERAGEDLNRGDYASAIGRVGTVAAQLLGPKAAETIVPKVAETLKSDVLQPAAEKLYQTKVKQPSTIGGQPLSPEAAQQRTQFNLREGLTADREGLAKRAAGQEASGSALRDIYSSDDSKTISAQPIQDSLDTLKQKYQKQGRPSAVRDVEAVEKEFFDQIRNKDGSVRDMTPVEAFDFKIGKQNEVTEAKQGAYAKGSKNSPDIVARQNIAGALGDQLVENFPDAAPENEKYSGFINAKGPLTKAVTNDKNAHTFGLLDRIAASVGSGLGAGAGALAHGAEGGVVGAMAGGTAGAFASKIINSPGFRTKVAIKLSRMAGDMPIPVAQAKALAYANAIQEESQARANAKQ